MNRMEWNCGLMEYWIFSFVDNKFQHSITPIKNQIKLFKIVIELKLNIYL